LDKLKILQVITLSEMGRAQKVLYNLVAGLSPASDPARLGKGNRPSVGFSGRNLALISRGKGSLQGEGG